jgi:enolase
LILDSHGGPTTEFLVELSSGEWGVGSSSQGETISIYEDSGPAGDPKRVVDEVVRDGMLGKEMDQVAFDRYLNGKVRDFGRNTCFALSLAFHDATAISAGGIAPGTLTAPRLCFNVLNGGLHAYTNPVLSDFAEFLVVPTHDDLLRSIREHERIQHTIAARLLSSSQVVVNGNKVNAFAEKDNSAPLRFLVEVLEELGLRGDYDLMVDASAGDLRSPNGYSFAVTDGARLTSADRCAYWLELVEEFSIGLLEDPFHEQDFAAWTRLTSRCGRECMVVGDNLYSSDAARIAAGIHEGHSTAAIVKPNQAGTVSATLDAIETAQTGGLTVITSHRSISTESTFVCDVTCERDVPYIKIGPLFSDYSSVIRLNQILRLTGVGYG